MYAFETCKHCDGSHLPRLGIRKLNKIKSESKSLNKKPYCTACVLLSEDVSVLPLCPCNYFEECICFNMSLANEQRQGMLQASSSWLTCIWHNVPCADRCRVAVWSSGFYHCKRIRHDWCSGKADSMNYGGLIRACRKWFILLQNMVIHHICLCGYMVRVHIMFCSFISFLGVSFSLY